MRNLKMNMTLIEAIEQAAEIAERENPAIASVLLSTLGAIHGRNEYALMEHTAKFAKREVDRLTALRN